MSLRSDLVQCRHELIYEALAKTKGHVGLAGKLLDVPYSTLRMYIDQMEKEGYVYTQRISSLPKPPVAHQPTFYVVKRNESGFAFARATRNTSDLALLIINGAIFVSIDKQSAEGFVKQYNKILLEGTVVA